MLKLEETREIGGVMGGGRQCDGRARGDERPYKGHVADVQREARAEGVGGGIPGNEPEVSCSEYRNVEPSVKGEWRLHEEKGRN